MLFNQMMAVFNLSLRRLLHSRFTYGALLPLMAIPVGIAVVAVLFESPPPGADSEPAFLHGMHTAYEIMLRMLYLHFIVFFAACMFGFAIVRQELDDQTLHYTLLQPIPRWVLLAGKLVAYLPLASAACIASLWLTYLILAVGWFGFGAMVKDLFADGRFLILVKESLVLMLGLLVYGAIGMVMGSFLKSSAYAIILLAWESALPYLPSTLKFWTVMHYLHSLLPVQLPPHTKLYRLLGEPASLPVSLAVVAGVSLVAFAIAAAFFQRRECLYGEA